MAEYEGRWYIAPSDVRIQGGGWTQERVPVDGFERRETVPVPVRAFDELTRRERTVAGWMGLSPRATLI